ncbi:hypothetical protein ACUL41_14810 [Virgibacillus natechei]
MKKLFLLSIIVLFLAACGGEAEDTNEQANATTPTEEATETEESTEEEPTQEELDAQLKEEAIEADFVAINGDEVEEDTKIHATGTIDMVMEDGVMDEFMFTTEEGDGYGMYIVHNLDMDAEIQEGETIKVYGTYSGKDEEMSAPILSTTIIEPAE